MKTFRTSLPEIASPLPLLAAWRRYRAGPHPSHVACCEAVSPRIYGVAGPAARRRTASTPTSRQRPGALYLRGFRPLATTGC